MPHFKQPEQFNFLQPSEWPTWSQRFKRFRFDTYFRPKVNYLEYRVLFQNRVQNYDEPIEQLIRDLYEIAENCNYGENKHENIRDRIVIGCQDKEVSQSLRLKGNELTLDDAITTARQCEQVKSQLSTKRMTDVDELTSQFKTMSRKRNTGYKGGQKYHRDAANEHKHDWQSRSRTQSCGRCGRSHKPEEICPARDRKCRKCDKIGHVQTVCRTKSVKEVKSTESWHCKHNYFLGSVTNVMAVSNVSFKVDSGADVSTLDIELYRSMVNPPDLRQTSDTLSGAGGEIECYGKFRTTTKFKDQEYAVDFYVINGSNLLRRTDASALRFLKFDRDPRAIEELRIDPDVFGDTGLMKTSPVNIKINENATPYHVNVARRVAPPPPTYTIASQSRK